MKKSFNEVTYQGASQKFIEKYSRLKDQIGKPVVSRAGEDFYPILDEELYLRYYMSRSYCIYDAVEKDAKKYGPSIDAHLISTITGDKKIISAEELYWKTFYRFPMGKGLPRKSNGDLRRLERGVHFTGDNESGYFIEGILFKKVKFDNKSALFKAFNGDGAKLFVSEDGAVFDLTRGKLRNILLDDDGMPYIQSKTGVRVLVPHLIAMGWLDNGQIYQKYRIHTIAEHILFCSTQNLVYIPQHNHKDKLPSSHGLVIQDACDGSDDIGELLHIHPRWSTIKWKKKTALSTIEKKLGKFYRIPIEGLSNTYRISKNGLVYSMSTEQLLTPIRAVCKDRKSVEDIKYHFPEARTTLSAVELMLWTFYRLHREDVAEVIPNIQLHKKYRILAFANLWFISKTIPQVDVNCDISGKVYRHSSIYPTLYVSKTGAIYDIIGNKFVDYYQLQTIGNFLCIRTEIYTKEKLINPGMMVYRAWISDKIPSGTTVCTKNGIAEDVSMHNVTLTILTPTNIRDSDIARIQKLSEKLPAIRAKECKMVANEYGDEVAFIHTLKSYKVH